MFVLKGIGTAQAVNIYSFLWELLKVFLFQVLVIWK